MKRHEQARASRARLVEVARACFSERGYADTSVAEILRRAGIDHRRLRAVFVVDFPLIQRRRLGQAFLAEGRGRKQHEDACGEPKTMRVGMNHGTGVLPMSRLEGGIRSQYNNGRIVRFPVETGLVSQSAWESAIVVIG